MKNATRNSRRSALGLLSLVPLALGLSLSASSPAQAGAGIYDLPDTCTTINCSAQMIFGAYIKEQFGLALPFTTQVFAAPATTGCLRLDVSAAGAGSDFEMVVNAPDGTVYRNDNKAVGNLRPLVVVPATSLQTGWYSVQLSSANGTDSSALFQMQYGLYTGANNPNCNNPTPAL